MKSKISGAPQVFATLFHTYSRPIPVPIRNLRPAREICEGCHWPEKFYGAQLMQNPHFRYDEKNTPEQVSLLVRTGGCTTRKSITHLRFAASVTNSPEAKTANH